MESLEFVQTEVPRPSPTCISMSPSPLPSPVPSPPPPPSPSLYASSAAVFVMPSAVAQASSGTKAIPKAELHPRPRACGSERSSSCSRNGVLRILGAVHLPGLRAGLRQPELPPAAHAALPGEHGPAAHARDRAAGGPGEGREHYHYDYDYYDYYKLLLL